MSLSGTPLELNSCTYVLLNQAELSDKSWNGKRSKERPRNKLYLNVQSIVLCAICFCNVEQSETSPIFLFRLPANLRSKYYKLGQTNRWNSSHFLLFFFPRSSSSSSLVERCEGGRGEDRGRQGGERGRPALGLGLRRALRGGRGRVWVFWRELETFFQKYCVHAVKVLTKLRAL